MKKAISTTRHGMRAVFSTRNSGSGSEPKLSKIGSGIVPEPNFGSGTSALLLGNKFWSVNVIPLKLWFSNRISCECLGERGWMGSLIIV